MAATITASVGKNGVNRQADVYVVQVALNNWILLGALKGRVAPLTVTTGTCDAKTIEAIGAFQKVVLGSSTPDYRVDRHGRTLKRLVGPITTATAAETRELNEKLKRVNWKGHQPIFYQLEMLMVESFPFLTRLGYGKHWSGMWAYVDRTQKNGKPSDHAEGRAVDIYLSAYEDGERQLGDGLFDMFKANGIALGVDHVIWNRRIWSQEKGGPRPYTSRENGPHDDHVHVSFTRAGSQTQTTLLDKLIPELRQTLDFQRWDGLRRVEGFENQRPEDLSPYD